MVKLYILVVPDSSTLPSDAMIKLFKQFYIQYLS